MYYIYKEYRCHGIPEWEMMRKRDLPTQAQAEGWFLECQANHIEACGNSDDAQWLLTEDCPACGRPTRPIPYSGDGCPRCEWYHWAHRLYQFRVVRPYANSDDVQVLATTSILPHAVEMAKEYNANADDGDLLTYVEAHCGRHEWTRVDYTSGECLICKDRREAAEIAEWEAQQEIIMDAYHEGCIAGAKNNPFLVDVPVFRRASGEALPVDWKHGLESQAYSIACSNGHADTSTMEECYVPAICVIGPQQQILGVAHA